MVVIGNVSFDCYDQDAVARLCALHDQTPEWIKRSGPFFKIVDNGLMQAMTIFEFSSERLEEAWQVLEEQAQVFFNVIGSSHVFERWIGMPHLCLSCQRADMEGGDASGISL